MPDLTVLTYSAVRGPALTKKAGLRGEYPEDIHAAICGKGILTCQDLGLSQQPAFCPQNAMLSGMSKSR